jgi:hypothetical protein
MHFAVLVISDNPFDALKPFNERPDDYPKDEYYFSDNTDFVSKIWNKSDWIGQTYYPLNAKCDYFLTDINSESIVIDLSTLILGEYINLPSGNIVTTKDITPGRHLKLDKNGVTFHLEVVKRTDNLIECKRVDPPVKFRPQEKYSSLKEFACEYYGMAFYEGKCGYWVNPEGKWDWYEIGGRWNRQIALKKRLDGTMPALPDFGIPTDEYGPHDVNAAFKKDIDWMFMMNGSPTMRSEAAFFWETFVEGKNRDLYKGAMEEFLNPEYFLEEYGDMENFVYRACQTVIKDAVLLDNQWIDTEDKYTDPVDFYNDFIKDLPDDALLTVVDCHI